MMNFLIYEGKVAVALLVFYLLYRFLLKKETFHRFNRWVLVGTAVLSFVLPLCVITIHRHVEMETVVMQPEISASTAVPAVVESGEPWWPAALAILFWAGVAFALVRVVFSILSVLKMIRKGELVLEEEDGKIVVTENDIDPFSWMHYIVLSRADWESSHASIIIHEKAHVKSGHSIELLLVDVLSAFQWFNPAIRMLRTDLRELHEYEADDAVLRSGADIKEYQYLLLRKTVSKGGYSAANSFNHSILKNRIIMMTKTKSPLSRGLRALYMLPFVCLCIGLQARTVNEPKDKIDQGSIRTIKLLRPDVAKKKYGDRANQGVMVVTMKRPRKLDGIHKEQEDDKKPPLVYRTLPSFQGEGSYAFSTWLDKRIARSKSVGKAEYPCVATVMVVSFVVDTDGAVKDVMVQQGIREELDNLVASLVKQSPKWEPATVNGKPEPQSLSMIITFLMKNNKVVGHYTGGPAMTI